MQGGAVVRCDPLDAEWQTLGAGRFRGVVAEGIEATANAWGPDQLTFRVKQVDAGALRPELLPFSPIELEVDGQLVWAGRVRARPSDEREHSVTCEGWQYHLDDDALDRVWVHTRLGDYRDQRTFLGANLAATAFHAGGNVQNDDGAIVIGWSNATVFAVGSSVGVTLDLGPDSYGRRVVMTWDSSNNWASATAYCKGTDGEDATAGADNAFSFLMNSGASGTSSGTLAANRRYIHVLLNQSTAVTATGDIWLRIKSLKVFRNTADEAFNASILKASSVVADVLPFAPLLNQSAALIGQSGFAVPEHFTSGYASPREVIEGINAYENWEHRIGGSDLRTLVFQSKATVPEVVAGEWSGAQFADASVAGDDIYDQATVTGTGPDGSVLVRKRSQSGTLVDRQGFHRTKVLPIRSAGTAAVYDRFGDLWLGDHQLAPFAGKLSATSGLRRWLGGISVPPHTLLLESGSRVHLAHRVDPDTGAWGRDGIIVGVRYTHDERSVEIDVDDRRDHFESILQRYGILVDQFLR